MRKTKKKKIKFSKLIVAAIIALNSLFAAAILVVFWHTSAEPTVLVGSWFAFTTGELWGLSKITREEYKNNGKEEI